MNKNSLLRNCIEPKIEEILRKNQNGFRRTRSTSQILNIRRILEGVRAKKTKKNKTWGNNIIRRLIPDFQLHT